MHENRKWEYLYDIKQHPRVPDLILHALYIACQYPWSFLASSKGGF